MSAALDSTQLSARDDSPARIIPMSYALTETVVVSHAGDYMTSWLIEGLPFEGLSEKQALDKMNALNQLIRSLSNGRYAFWIHRIRREVADGLEVPPVGFARETMTKYYARMERGGLMATQIYLTVIYRPYPQKSRGVAGKAARNLTEFELENDAALDALDNVARQVASTLSEYHPTILGAYQSNGITYSDQLALYAFLVNGVWKEVPLKRLPLASYLARTRIFFGSEMIETRDEHGSVFSAFVDIKDYADFSSPGVLNTMLSLPCEYVETQSFSPMNTRDAIAALKRQRRQLMSGEDNAKSQILEIDEAIDAVSSGNFSFGEYHYTIQVKGESVERVKAARAAAIDALQDVGFLGVPLDLIPDHAYGAQLPGNWRSRPRVAALSSRNFTGLSTLHNFANGKRDGNPWGEAVTILQSPAGQPVYFNFHDSERDENSLGKPALGNTQIIGQSGGGKTVLALFLLMNLSKYGTESVVFDKDRGAEILVRAIGGQYLALERGKQTGFAPFKMEPTPETLLFWGDLVMFCTAIGEREHTAKEEADIRQAVMAVGQLPRVHRSFAAVLQNLQDTDENSLAARLRKWCRTAEGTPGPLGWALDSDDDLLQFKDGGCFGFDYTELLEDDRTCPAVMMYLMYRVEQRIDGRRFAFFMDEYWKALSVRYFEDFAENKQKTIRKQNGFGVFLTQSPSDTLASAIARTLIEQTATFIFLPNSTADRDDYVNGFKLTDAEFEVITKLTKGSRLFAIKQGDRFSLASLDLNGFSDALQVLSGTTANVARLETLRSRLGDDPGAWLQPFLKGES
ncbi:VirB4 family type IV secretion/conjugal transfer ATPase [Variovorax ginsengisoli]|uniref:Type IV secretion system protein VirB4 n=1 Tax=Variovorax ginsengisoli TaxID=363844 RepID=A0ABT9SDG9_9BURK|nr:VirB4 family type IV secretion/conjugal transfer ATPase [Variovorax ginsengisoli]MDP9902413.1 type IV secretion system protein VirB4 [Variovorax ginsengisoli]